MRSPSWRTRCSRARQWRWAISRCRAAARRLGGPAAVRTPRAARHPRLRRRGWRTTSGRARRTTPPRPSARSSWEAPVVWMPPSCGRRLPDSCARCRATGPHIRRTGILWWACALAGAALLLRDCPTLNSRAPRWHWAKSGSVAGGFRSRGPRTTYLRSADPHRPWISCRPVRPCSGLATLRPRGTRACPRPGAFWTSTSRAWQSSAPTLTWRRGPP
mmetsp:Transcript_4526/g.13346  ORF Transcript_4526/g.13346 Transcript_4526/m.13346 type:complete len:217 (-) Transcript_4526:131-781(-)